MVRPIKSVIVLLLVLSMLSASFAQPPATSPAPVVGLEALARSAPADAPFFFGLDFRRSTSTAAAWAKVQLAAAGSPALKQVLDQAQAQLGLSFDEVASWMAPAMYVVLLPPVGVDSLVGDGKSPDVVVAVAVTDEKAAADTLRKLQGTAASAVGVEADPTKACEHNLQAISSALEMYSIDNGGHYPADLAHLTPNYLKVIPTCPSAGSDTYSYQSAADAYTISCEGDHHGMGPHLPAWSSASGLAVGTVTTAPPDNAAPAFKSVTVEGCEVWLSPVNAHLAYTVHQGYVLAGTGPDVLGRVIRTLDGTDPSLDGTPTFQDARQHVTADDGALVWTALSGTVRHLLASPSVKDKIDDATVQGLTALQYVVVRLTPDPAGFQSEFFLKVDPQSTSPFAKALLATPKSDASLVRYFPASWGNYNTANITWAWHVVVEALKLFPFMRPEAEQIASTIQTQIGLDLDKDVLGATTGAYASASNVVDVLPQLISQSMGQVQGQGKKVSCENNLKMIGVALEMYAADHRGHYPKTLAGLVPKYLKRIPQCPAAQHDSYSASYQVHTHPDSYSFYCSGTNHADVGLPANAPRYNSSLGLVLPPGHGSATSSSPTVVLAVQLVSVEAAQKVIQKLEEKWHLKPLVAGRVGDVELHGYQNQAQYRWALVSTPEPVLLVGMGPQAQSWLETALRTPAAGPSMAEQPDYQALLKETAGRGLLSTDYTDLTPLVKLATQGAQTYLMMAGPSVQGIAAWVLQTVQGFEPLHGTTYMEVLPDGVHIVGHGASSMLIGIVAGAAAAVLVPNFAHARSQAQLTSCESNEKNIATALEIYAVDHQGHYPQKLQQLIPKYLKRLPICPSAGTDSYSETYHVGTNPDRYSFACSGDHHKSVGLPTGYPRYDSDHGLILVP